MTTLFVTIGFVAVAMLAMAVGVIFAGKRLQGSCGGPGSDDCLCEIEKRRACHAAKHMEELLARRGIVMDDHGQLGNDSAS